MKPPLLTALLSLACLAHISLTGQKIIWQKSIGGSGHDYVEDVIRTRDKGMLITCTSGSGISGDKTEMGYGKSDYWIIKTDPDGEIRWQKTLGGDQDDEPITVLEIRDGGYLICGESSSGISGNKTVAGYGKADYWVVRLDRKGKTIWQQSYGGSSVDHLVAAMSDPSGGYILAGHSWVGTDDPRYDTMKGKYDCWLIMINDKGEVLWEETIGGVHEDILTDAMMDQKGNIVVSGYTKTKTPGEGGQKPAEQKESGVFCISPDKRILWQKDFTPYGHYACEKLMTDAQNQYYLGGMVFPGSGKDDFSDLLILVLNENGEVVRDIPLGGNGQDFINALAVSSSNELYIGASTGSGISRDKSEPTLGMMDGWLCKYDSHGKKMWDKSLGGTGLESFAEMLIGPDKSLSVFLQAIPDQSSHFFVESKGETDIVIVRLEEE